MKKVENQFSISLKQHYDGQIQVYGIKVPPEMLREDPWLKDEIKHEMERRLIEAGMMVLPDIGVIEYD